MKESEVTKQLQQAITKLQEENTSLQAERDELKKKESELVHVANHFLVKDAGKFKDHKRKSRIR